MSLVNGKAQGLSPGASHSSPFCLVAESNCGGKTLVLPGLHSGGQAVEIQPDQQVKAQQMGISPRDRGFCCQTANPTGVLLCHLQISDNRGHEGRKDEMRGGAGGEARGGFKIRSGRAHFPPFPPFPSFTFSRSLINPKHLGMPVPLSRCRRIAV